MLERAGVYQMQPDVLRARFVPLSEIYLVVFPDVVSPVRELSLNLLGGFVRSLASEEATQKAATFLTRTVAGRYISHETRNYYGAHNASAYFDPDRGPQVTADFQAMHGRFGELQDTVGGIDRRLLRIIKQFEEGLDVDDVKEMMLIGRRNQEKLNRLRMRMRTLESLVSRFVPGPYDTDIKVGFDQSGVSQYNADLIGEHWIESAVAAAEAMGGKIIRRKDDTHVLLQIGDDIRNKNTLSVAVEFGSPPINPDIRYGQIVIKGAYGLAQPGIQSLSRNELMVLHLGFFPPDKGTAERRVGGINSVAGDIALKLHPINDGRELYIPRDSIRGASGTKFAPSRLKTDRYHAEVDIDKDVEVMVREVREKILHHPIIRSESDVDALFEPGYWTALTDLIGTASARFKEGETSSNFETLQSVYLQELLIWLDADPYLANSIAKRVGFYRLFPKVAEFASQLPNYFQVSDVFTLGTIVDPGNNYSRSPIPGYMRNPRTVWEQRQYFLEAAADQLPTPQPITVEEFTKRITSLSELQQGRLWKQVQNSGSAGDGNSQSNGEEALPMRLNEAQQAELWQQFQKMRPDQKNLDILRARSVRRMSGLKLTALALMGRDVKKEEELYEAPTTEELFHLVNTFAFDSVPLTDAVEDTLRRHANYPPDYFGEVVMPQIEIMFSGKDSSARYKAGAQIKQVWQAMNKLAETGKSRFTVDELKKFSEDEWQDRYFRMMQRLGIITQTGGTLVRPIWEVTPRMITDDILQYHWREGYGGKEAEQRVLNESVLREVYRSVQNDPEALIIVKNFMDNAIRSYFPNLRAAVYAGIDFSLVKESAERLSTKTEYKSYYRLLAIKRCLEMLVGQDHFLKKTLTEEYDQVQQTGQYTHHGLDQEVADALEMGYPIEDYLREENLQAQSAEWQARGVGDAYRNMSADELKKIDLTERGRQSLRRALYFIDVVKPAGLLKNTPWASYGEIVRSPKLTREAIMDATVLYNDSRSMGEIFGSDSALYFLQMWMRLDHLYQWEKYLHGLVSTNAKPSVARGSGGSV